MRGERMRSSGTTENDDKEKRKDKDNAETQRALRFAER